MRYGELAYGDRTAIRRYYLFKATTTLGLYSPIFTLFLLDRNLSYPEIGTLVALSAVLTVLFEVPTGYLGDRFGRKETLTAGSVCLAISVLALVVAASFGEFVFVWVFFSLGLALQSGTDDAWLYDYLSVEGDEDAFVDVRGTGKSVNLWSTAASMLISGVLFDIHSALPFTVSTVLLSGSALVAYILPSTTVYGDAGPTLRSTFETSVAVLARYSVGLFVLYVGLFFGATWVINDYIQPISIYRLSVPVWSIGPFFALLAGLSGFGSYYADIMSRGRSDRRTVVSLVGIAGLALIVSMLFEMFVLPAFMILKTVQSAAHPIVSNYLNDAIESVDRATTLSAAQTVYGLIRFPIAMAGGVIAGAYSPIVVVWGLGIAVLVTTLLAGLCLREASEFS